MKEAIGSTWLMGMIITFIAIFSGFLAYSISYTKAFRVKNEVINIIEKNEGFTFSTHGRIDPNSVDVSTLRNDTSTEAQAFLFIKSIGYNYSMFNNNSNPCKEGELQAGGYCLAKRCPNSVENGSDRVYYKVTTYISLSIPFLDFGIKIPISGETKSLYNNGLCE